MSKASEIAKQLSAQFLEKGNYQAIGSAMSKSAIDRAVPAATTVTPISLSETGFDGLSVQAIGYSHGKEIDKETIQVYVTKGSRKFLFDLRNEISGVEINIVNIGRLILKPEAAHTEHGCNTPSNV